MKYTHAHVLLIAGLLLPCLLPAQHNYEFNNQGAAIYISSGATVYVWGDVYMEDATALLSNSGEIEVQGNMYSDNLFQQRGTGTVRIENSDVNVNQRQFIEGSYAVRGGQSAVGVDDGSFYHLQLANSQGVVHLAGSGNVADVRGSVNFDPAVAVGNPPQNRLITHDTTALPANGSGYNAIFGMMNTSAITSSLNTYYVNNTVSANGNSSTVDAGYIQGKLRVAIGPMGGDYPFVLGLEPGGITDARGLQYSRLNFSINTYDVVTGYFEEGSSNAVPGTVFECPGDYQLLYFGGITHGEWMFSDRTGTGAGSYSLSVWPQDGSLSPQTMWLITQDDTVRGTDDDCGGSAIGLSRGGFNGFEGPSEFGVAGLDFVLEDSPDEAPAASLAPEYLSLHMYPSPFDSKGLTMSLTGPLPAYLHIEVFDLLGRKVWEGHPEAVPELHLPGQAFPPGLLSFRIHTGNEVFYWRGLRE
jgi:hypothetical protein